MIPTDSKCGWLDSYAMLGNETIMLPRTLTEKWRYMALLNSGFSRIQNESDDYHIQNTHSTKIVRTQESRRFCETSFNSDNLACVFTMQPS